MLPTNPDARAVRERSRLSQAVARCAEGTSPLISAANATRLAERPPCDLELGSFEVIQFHAVSYVVLYLDCDHCGGTGCHIQFRSPGCRGG